MIKKSQKDKKGSLFVLSASSGTGKTTVMRRVIKKAHKNGLSLEQVVTYTKSVPRKDEVGCKDYYFVSVAIFEKKIEEGVFLKWSDA